jgi:hypothetical protein
MRKTIRGRGARGFIEPKRNPLLPAEAVIDLLSGGGAMVTFPARTIDGKLHLIQDILAHNELFTANPLLSMRAARR